MTQTLTGGNLPGGIGQPQFTVDQNTNRIVGMGYDAAGNQTSDGSFSYAYDGAGRLYTVTNTAEYTYFGGLRIKKVVGSTTTVTIYSGANPIAEYVNGALSKEYIYSGSALLATIAGSVVTYHNPDHLSDRAETDSAGSVLRTYGHFPFGETWYETGTADKWKFTSYARDTGESDLDYASFRYYGSGLGRFSSPDLMGGHLPNPQSLNRYTYTLDDPMNLIDPLGLDTSNIGSPCPGDPRCPSNPGNGGRLGPGNDGAGNDLVGSAGGVGGRRRTEQPSPGDVGGGFLRTLKTSFCRSIPDGRTVGISGALGAVGSVTGGGEIVYNYNTGQTSAFAFGGVGVGWNGGASVTVTTGFIRNLGNSNSNYAGPFTGASGTIGVPGLPIGAGGFMAVSSKGISNPGQIDPKGAPSVRVCWEP